MIIQHPLHFAPGSPAAAPVLFLIFSALFFPFLLLKRRSSRLLLTALLLGAGLLLQLTAENVLTASALSGSGTEEDPWLADNWTELSEKVPDGGWFKLNQNIQIPLNDSFTVFGGTTVHLDLNGKILTGSEGGGVITVLGGGNFTLDDKSSEKTGKITHIEGAYGSGVDSYGIFTMNGGTISDNNAIHIAGGGVYVGGGSFTMNGGEISGNRADIGGGVYVDNSCFTMKNGTISGNEATGGGQGVLSKGNGGGVHVRTGGSFIMENGTISENNAKNSGGGVYVDDVNSSFTMKGGMISGNKNESDDDDDRTYGGGVSIVMGNFTMEDGTISENSADYGGGVYVQGDYYNMEDDFTMNGGEISGNQAAVGGGVFVNTVASVEMNGGKITGNSALGAGGVLDFGSFIMKGGEISGNNTESDDGRNFGGGVFADGDFTMEDGTISDNTASHGGGVYVDGKNFVMKGGEISGNKNEIGDDTTFGGGVYIFDGSFTMESGTISDNAASSGGGVYVFDGSFTMDSGTISGNSSANGGGVYVSKVNDDKGINACGTFTMEEGIISENEASESGGGVYVTGIINLGGGEIKITGNTLKTPEGEPPANNVLLADGAAAISIIDTLSGIGQVGVSMETPGVFTSGLSGEGSPAYFFSDDATYKIGETDGGEAVLYTTDLTFSPDEGTWFGEQSVTISCAAEGASIYYTTDGSDPTTGSPLYTGPILISETAVIKAFAVAYGDTGETVSKTYNITTLSIEAPAFDPVTYGYAQPDAEAFSLTSTGGISIVITSAELSGADTGSFILTEGTPSVAANGTNSTYTIRPKAGLDAGEYKGKLILTYDIADISTKAAGDEATAEANVSFNVSQKTVTITAKDQTVSEDGSIETGPGQADLADALEGHELSAVTLTAEGNSIMPSDAEIRDGDGEDVTGNYDIQYEPGTLTVRGSVSRKVTFKVVNGFWDDNTAEDISVTLTGPEGTALKLAEEDIPAVGNNPEPGFTAGSWEPRPDPDTEIPEDVTYTYTYKAESEPEPRRRIFRMCEDCVLPATGFSSVRPTALSEQPADLRYEPVRMRLMLPTLDEDVELVTLPREGNTWAAAWLGADAGILEGSALPGKGTSVIAAHNTLNDTTYGPFAMLPSMEPGDRIFVTSEAGELLSFEVYANELLVPDDMQTIESLADENALVLITCENESTEGGYLNRRAVFAK